MEKLRKMTKKEVDKLRKKGEILTDKKLGDILRSLDKFTDNQYNNEGYCYVCVWCGDFIELLDNVVYYKTDLYHLKCMYNVHQTEKENRDL